MAEHNILGKEGEDIACAWLENNGYKIVTRNWRRGRNELDAVCLFNNLVVVVEIKSRRSKVEDIEQLLPPKKRLAIVRLAAKWLAEHKMQSELRFDLLVVDMSDKKVTHIPDAIMVYDV